MRYMQKPLGIRLIFLAVLGIALLLAYWWDKKESRFSSVRLWSSVSVVDSILLDFPESKIELFKVSDQFRVVVEDKDFPADTTLVSQFFEALQNLEALQVVSKTDIDKEIYGFAQGFSMTFTDSNKTFELQIGGADTGRRYLLFDRVVYLSEDIFPFEYSHDGSYWMDKMPFVALEGTEFASFSMKDLSEGGGLFYDVDLVRSGEGQNVVWNAMYENQESVIEDDSSLNTLFRQIRSLKADTLSYLEGDERVLATWSYQVENSVDGQVWNIGSANDDEALAEYLLWMPGSNLVYQMSDWRLQSVIRSPQQLGLESQ